jgi:hypothetical protein
MGSRDPALTTVCSTTFVFLETVSHLLRIHYLLFDGFVIKHLLILSRAGCDILILGILDTKQSNMHEAAYAVFSNTTFHRLSSGKSEIIRNGQLR